MKLRTPQVRVLQALVDALLDGRESLSRKDLNEQAGFTGVSGTLTRVLNGLREGSSSGAAHPGLIALGLVDAVRVDVSGRIEMVYRITENGLAEFEGARVPASMRDRAASTNHRYRKGKHAVD